MKNEIKRRFEQRGQEISTPVTKDIGYELRCAPPIPFDSELARDLGFGAVKFLLRGGSGALINIHERRLTPIPFSEMIDKSTGKITVRYVDTNTESYDVAREYMIRLKPEDFQDEEHVRKLARTANLTPDEFTKRFKYLVE